MNLAERFRSAREDAGFVKPEYTLGQVAKLLGISGSALTQIENGDTIKLKADTLLKASKLFKVNPVWLQSGKGSRSMMVADDKPDDDDPQYPAIRRVKFKLSAGISGFAIEYENPKDGPPMYFHRSWYDRNNYDPKALYAFKVSGDSMRTGLVDGDTVVVNTADVTPEDGAVFAVNYEGELVIKRLFKIGDEWIAASDNPDKTRYRDKPLNGHTVIVGRIVHKQSEAI